METDMRSKVFYIVMIAVVTLAYVRIHMFFADIPDVTPADVPNVLLLADGRYVENPQCLALKIRKIEHISRCAGSSCQKSENLTIYTTDNGVFVQYDFSELPDATYLVGDLVLDGSILHLQEKNYLFREDNACDLTKERAAYFKDYAASAKSSVRKLLWIITVLYGSCWFLFFDGMKAQRRREEAAEKIRLENERIKRRNMYH